ncbi:unnamed protein product, partial [Mesorhabditis belari]|uniref:Transmembrane protein n=1 Tax=Mesorhabditis belari TaxID=2138241 RepID=A0AAF3EHT1_9BILA
MKCTNYPLGVNRCFNKTPNGHNTSAITDNKPVLTAMINLMTGAKLGALFLGTFYFFTVYQILTENHEDLCDCREA